MLNPFSWSLDSWFFALQVLSFAILGVTVGVGYLLSVRQAKEILELKTGLSNALEKQFDAERKLIELQERQRPRHISIETVAAALKGKATGTIRIVCDPSVPDSYDPLGMEIQVALEQGGWTVEPMQSLAVEPRLGSTGRSYRVNPTFRQGVTIEGILEDCEDKDSPWCSLWRAFKASGLEFQGVRAEGLPKDSFRMLIGPRPLLPTPPTE